MEEKKNGIFFAIVLHIHQPIGNFERIIERAYKKSYLPFIEVLSEFPDIKINLHISGCLFDYFEKAHPEFLERISKMSTDGQIELLGGAYYEPILSAIPRQDLCGQIKMLSTYIKSRFGCKVRGLWIPERVWANELVDPLSESALQYCILDDTHLLRAGVLKEEMYGYFLAKDRNKEIAVFPSDKKLRYLIPFGRVYDVIQYFRNISERKSHSLFVYGDDGEKFGEWPGTYKWVYEEGWLKNFFSELIKNRQWLKLIHLSRYLDSGNSPLGEVKVPEASYDEMMEWTGGSWFNFLSKYPEANQMHKKMLYVSQKLERALLSHSQNKRLEDATQHLYKGQCNCAYWHGVFGGLYLYHLRSSIYEHLIEADKIIDSVLHEKEKEWVDIKRIDFDSDGEEEIIMETESAALYFDPQEGGILKELDFRPCSANFINTLSRREEPYHRKILEMANSYKQQSGPVRTIHDDIREIDPSIFSWLSYDRYPRYCLRDYFIDKDIEKIGSFIPGECELGDFSGAHYKAEINKGALILWHSFKSRESELKLFKEITISAGNKFEIRYRIEKSRWPQWNGLLAVEFNITMPFLDSTRYTYYADKNKVGGLNEEGRIKGPSSFGIIDSEKLLDFKLKFSGKPREVRYFPIKTVSQSERTYELNYQCSCILPIWELDFKNSEVYNFRLSIEIR